MIAVKSPLGLQDFTLFRSDYKFVPSGEEEFEPEEEFDNYQVDIDFMLRTNDEVNFRLFMKIAINKESRLPGYNLLVEGVGSFNFDDKAQLSSDEKATMLQSSALSIVVNQLRNVLSNITSYAPFGIYILPAIDINDLLDKKREQLKAIAAQNKSKRKGSKKS